MRVSSVLTTVLSVILSLPFAASANDKGVATLTKAESISSMLEVIEHLTTESTGKFFNYDGEELPW